MLLGQKENRAMFQKKKNLTLLTPDNLLLPKTREYDEAYLSSGFTVNVVGDEEIFISVYVSELWQWTE